MDGSVDLTTGCSHFFPERASIQATFNDPGSRAAAGRQAAFLTDWIPIPGPRWPPRAQVLRKSAAGLRYVLRSGCRRAA